MPLSDVMADPRGVHAVPAFFCLSQLTLRVHLSLFFGQVLQTVKRLETQGYSYEGADASVNLLVRRTMSGYVAPFK